MTGQNILGFLMIAAGLALTCGGALLLARGKTSEATSSRDRVEEALTSEEKGRKFEEWVVGKFDRSNFIIKDWRGDKQVAGIYAESSMFPDLEIEFRLRDRRASFAVECKWRRSFNPGRKAGIEWATSRQIDTYQGFQRDRGLPVFAVIGIGGEPDHPAELYVAPLDRMKYPFASAEHLAKFRRGDLTKNFYYDDEKSELR